VIRDILHPTSRPVLEQFAWSKVLVAFDFDGTLAPIVTQPDRARMRRDTRRLLYEVAGRYPCAVISGRARRDVLHRLTGIPLGAVVGNHGLEDGVDCGRFAATVRRWRVILERALQPVHGVWVEDKGLSLAIHYRKSRRKREALAAISHATSALDAARLVGGKQVVNVLPRGAPHKGMALERSRRQLGCDTAIYVGDDESDEDVFSLDAPGRLLTIRVEPKETSMAAYYLRCQQDVDRMLRLLVELRRGPGNQRRAEL
jgi:trehalose 6-phosphate phosphatase